MPRSFTEQDSESYYDAEDEIYRSLWDEDGSVHWGVFDSSTGDNFQKAGINLNLIMVEKGQITKDDTVLDVGCGNGTTAIWLSQNVGCAVKGIDLSGARIGKAQQTLFQLPADLQARIAFEKASATELPYDDNTFSRVWSQGSIYHVHEQEAALRECLRVLQPGGIFVFDDLFKPQPNISDAGRKHVYERLLFDTDQSFESYQATLESIGFGILESINQSDHLWTSYARLADMADEKDGPHKAHFETLSLAYRETVKAVARREIGWGLFVCEKFGVQGNSEERESILVDLNIPQQTISQQDLESLQSVINNFMESIDFAFFDDVETNLGSFFGKQKFLSKPKTYSKNILKKIATGNQINEQASHLLKELGKFDSLVLRIGNIIIIKTSIRGKPSLDILEMPLELKQEIVRNPRLLRNPDEVLEFIDQLKRSEITQDTYNNFNVFLCYNSHDKQAVEAIGFQLIEKGVKPWLDTWAVRPGTNWQAALTEQIENIPAVAVFIGPEGEGPWQAQELNAFIQQFVKRKCPVIPVLLPIVKCT